MKISDSAAVLECCWLCVISLSLESTPLVAKENLFNTPSTTVTKGIQSKRSLVCKQGHGLCAQLTTCDLHQFRPLQIRL